MKNSLLKEHFLHPQNIGVAENFTHKTLVKSDQCNDVISVTGTIANSIIHDIKIEVYGCGYAIAGASLMSEAAKGKSIEEAKAAVKEILQTVEYDVPDSNKRCIYLSHKALEKLCDQIEVAK